MTAAWDSTATSPCSRATAFRRFPSTCSKRMRITSLFPSSAIDLDLLAVGSSFARGNENNLDQPDGIYYLGPGTSPGYGW